jgi:hypothetical protein
MKIARSVTLAIGAAALPACDDLTGFGGEVQPLATIQIQLEGDLAAVRDPDTGGASLRIALVWGAQWLPERACFSPSAPPELTAVRQAGCRNPFAFTPARVAASAEAAPGVPLELPLFELPSADVMIGGLTARVAYGSLVVFDDRDASGSLELARPRRLPGSRNGPPDEDEEDLDSADIVYGASFVAMTEPDTRLAFREGAFNAAAAFYPRSGCGEPPPAFSIARAGGFSVATALAAAAAGRLPPQDPASCREAATTDDVVAIALRPPAEVREVGCQQRRADGVVRYREPPAEPLDLTELPHACAPVADTDQVELVIATRPGDTCKGLTHYVLRGCDDATELACEQPEWDFTAAPPSWWPCTGGQP